MEAIRRPGNEMGVGEGGDGVRLRNVPVGAEPRVTETREDSGLFDSYRDFKQIERRGEGEGDGGEEGKDGGDTGHVGSQPGRVQGRGGEGRMEASEGGAAR